MEQPGRQVNCCLYQFTCRKYGALGTAVWSRCRVLAGPPIRACVAGICPTHILVKRINFFRVAPVTFLLFFKSPRPTNRRRSTHTETSPSGCHVSAWLSSRLTSFGRKSPDSLCLQGHAETRRHRSTAADLPACFLSLSRSLLRPGCSCKSRGRIRWGDLMDEDTSPRSSVGLGRLTSGRSGSKPW